MSNVQCLFRATGIVCRSKLVMSEEQLPQPGHWTLDIGHWTSSPSTCELINQLTQSGPPDIRPKLFVNDC